MTKNKNCIAYKTKNYKNISIKEYKDSKRVYKICISCCYCGINCKFIKSVLSIFKIYKWSSNLHAHLNKESLLCSISVVSNKKFFKINNVEDKILTLSLPELIR